jgi:hypothetical protein
MLLRRNSPKSNDVERGHAGILFLCAGSHRLDPWWLGELALIMCLKMACGAVNSYSCETYMFMKRLKCCVLDLRQLF